MPARRIRVEYRPEAFGDFTNCTIGSTVCAFQENPSRLKVRGVRRLHKLQHRRLSSCLPGETRSSKGPRRSEIAQATASSTWSVPARRTPVEERFEAFEDCTSCIIGGTVHARQEHTGRVKLWKLHQLHHRRHW